MSDSEAWVDLAPAEPAEPPTAMETHISTLFFAGHRAYKLLKPVRYDFIDFSTREQRLEAARREVELNRRLAPDVYLGVMDLVDDRGQAIDHMIVMRRMPSDRRLGKLLLTAEAPSLLREVARRVAAFHAGASRTLAAARAAERDVIAQLWDDNFDTMTPMVGDLFGRNELMEIDQLASEYLAGRGPLFEKRVADGHAIDGHGDLLAEDIFCLDDGPRILDCLAFDDELRYGDVLADIAFLIMDVERLAGAELGRQLMRLYCEFSDEHHPGSLAHHYVAYRAHVRAKVAGLRAAQGDAHARTEAHSLIRLCHAHLQRAQVKLILVGGTPATGKSTVAEAIASATGSVLLGSDELRKELSGLASDEPAEAPVERGIYQPEMTATTYAALLERGEMLLELGESVVLDASWADAGHRAAARELARSTHAKIVEVQCEAIFQPARRRSAASTKSWLRITPPKGRRPGRSGSPAHSAKARVRISALCPQ